MTDFFLLVQLAAQGDELQGIKKGVIELADGILVNKCDGNMVERSMLKKAELSGVLRGQAGGLLPPESLRRHGHNRSGGLFHN